jgi:hypothetical protein
MALEKIIELVGLWFTGLATFSAALVALFLPKLYRPRLSVSCNKDGIGSSSYMLVDAPGSSPVAELWIKVGVKNKSSLNAEDVQLRLIMTHDNALPHRQGYRLFSSWWLKVSALNIVAISIPPKYTQYYDLCYLAAHPSRSVSVHLLAVRPPLEDWTSEKARIESDQKRTLQPGCEYNVVFAVAGKNTHAGYYEISISYDVPSQLQTHGLALDEAALRRAIKIGRPQRVSREIELDEFAAI